MKIYLGSCCYNRPFDDLTQERIYLESEARSRQIREQSEIRMLDSLQIAFAEAAQADVMLTTDDRLEKMASRVPLNIRVLNPLRFGLETLFGR